MKTFILLLTLCAFQLNAQFTLYTPENSDLPSTYFSNIIIDFDNVIWLGAGINLVKFENDKFTTYNSSNSILPNEVIVDMYIDTKGILWLLYEEQIYKMYNDKFVFVKSIEYGKKIAVDRNGDLIFGSNMSLLKLKSDLSIDTLFKSDILDHKSVSKIIVDKGNNIWFTRNFDDGIRKITSDSTLYYGVENTGLPISSLNQIALDSSNNIWLGGNGQLYKYNQTTKIWSDIISEFPSKLDRNWTYNDIAFDRLNNPIIISSRNGKLPSNLNIIRNKDIDVINFDSLYNEELFIKSSRALAVDLDDNIYFNANMTGLVEYSGLRSTVSRLNEINIKLYPNPTTSSLRIELENDELATSYKITDTKGKQVLTGSLSPSSSVSIDVEQLPVGVYMIEITTSSGEIVIDKFLKE
ncbi:MAG: T9SS type A sorting domain-containing protein [Ignavibacteria bacterium]|nr:T9SS type A sorting domain-containing protein [Ignavibacteria bacterium]